MAEGDGKDQAPEKVRTPQRRLVPNLPAIQNFLKKDLGGDFAKGLKERHKKPAVNAPITAMSLDEKFKAMLLADINMREGKSRITR
jgi:hypothetical protein